MVPAEVEHMHVVEEKAVVEHSLRWDLEKVDRKPVGETEVDHTDKADHTGVVSIEDADTSMLMEVEVVASRADCPN